MTAADFRQQLAAGSFGNDSTYAEVNSAALPAYYDWFKSKLFDLGVTKWDVRQDCDDFANLYADFLHLRFYLGQWDSGSLPTAQGAAVARVFYRPMGSMQNHAVNAVATERGLLYVEPQTGQILNLSLPEFQSRYSIIF
jgi:hypothetical protein